mmetsp:Transcript_2789/g.5808  ORF Transcript_2789/g.5808 Transcript_2789/m.5808 type:complete len:86 (+) Transcript_2789:74-331(+)
MDLARSSHPVPGMSNPFKPVDVHTEHAASWQPPLFPSLPWCARPMLWFVSYARACGAPRRRRPPYTAALRNRKPTRFPTREERPR